VNIAVVRNPTEMRPFVGGHAHSVSYAVTLSDDVEPTVRTLVDRIFSDVEYISADEPGLVSAYLDGVSEPLRELQRYGLSILAVSETGTYRFDDGSTMRNWVTNFFLVIPTLGYFRLDREGSEVHRFDPGCCSVASDLSEAMRSNVGMRVWPKPEAIREQYEDAVAWCINCCLAEALAVDRCGVSVAPPDLRFKRKIVEQALADSEVLLERSGPVSAVDRVHTALHGYLRAVAESAGIEVGHKPNVSQLWGRIRQTHPMLTDQGAHTDFVVKVLRNLSGLLDALNDARNQWSLAHPSELPLLPAEAALAIDVARTILHYVDQKLHGGT
jgi:hypothetical protein